METESQARDGQWYAARVRTCCEKKVRDELHASQNVDTWVAVQLEQHQWSDRLKRIERVVLKHFVFFRYAAKDERCEIVSYPPFRKITESLNVLGLLVKPGTREPAPIPNEQIETFKRMLEEANSKVEMVCDDAIELGDHVMVTRGKFKGLDGYVAKSPNGRGKIYVVIDYFGYASMEIDLDSVKPMKRGRKQ